MVIALKSRLHAFLQTIAIVNNVIVPLLAFQEQYRFCYEVALESLNSFWAAARESLMRHWAPCSCWTLTSCTETRWRDLCSEKLNMRQTMLLFDETWLWILCCRTNNLHLLRRKKWNNKHLKRKKWTLYFFFLLFCLCPASTCVSWTVMWYCTVLFRYIPWMFPSV